MQRQLDEKGLKVRKGVAQDASFIEADPGPSGKSRGDEALTRRSMDGDWAVRKASVFGFKLHVKTDPDLGLVRVVEVTSTSVHDSRARYFGVEPIGFDATIRRGVRGHHLNDAEKLRNRRIDFKRSRVERTFAVVKRVFHTGRVLVASLPRVRVKMVFLCLCFNLLQMFTVGAVR